MEAPVEVEMKRKDLVQRLQIFVSDLYPGMFCIILDKKKVYLFLEYFRLSSKITSFWFKCK